MSLDKITNPFHIRHWLGDMEADYIYTLGIAGEHFFKEIKENGRIMGAKCPRCNVVIVPPRMYCEKCFAKLEEWVDVGTKGTIHTFTVATIDVDGKKLKEPVIFALIKFERACGGLIHKIGETKTKEVKIGMNVEAVFKPSFERKASINDIKYFKPTE
ncbi:Zn-ribbon domain-containing OB-fold protein [Candidatus Bathyarchaeota archaeon]|nr:Zn-ribbon domain-containing OB-fold protein [Candidatus Bathyarchaeota archaeon]